MIYLTIILLLLLIILNIKKMKIKDYPKDAQANYNDKVIGTDATTGQTFNYTFEQIKETVIPIPIISQTEHYQDYLDSDGVLNLSKIQRQGKYFIDTYFREQDNSQLLGHANQAIILSVDIYNQFIRQEYIDYRPASDTDPSVIRIKLCDITDMQSKVFKTLKYA